MLSRVFATKDHGIIAGITEKLCCSNTEQVFRVSRDILINLTWVAVGDIELFHLLSFSHGIGNFFLSPFSIRVHTHLLAGLNTVETYVPWNLHEETKGNFDFSGMLDLVSFVRLAEKLGLYVIIRPGPYICAEWDWGGLPAWLLRDRHMRVRTMYKPYLNAVDEYFDKLLPMLVDLQYMKGGPVIAVQIENEYGSFGADTRYLLHLLSLYEKHGFSTDSTLFFTSDNEAGLETGYIPGILMTVNCQTNVTLNLNVLRTLQPDRPVMVMEFWTGWFDHWGEKHGGYVGGVGFLMFHV